MTMHNYKVGEIVTRPYTVSPMPPVLRPRIGSPIPINEDGVTVAMGRVVSTEADTYKLLIINTYGHRRGPSEIK